MKLFIVSTDDYGCDEFDSHVIAAHNPEEAKDLADLPGTRESWKVDEIGTFNQEIVGVVHSSFNAG